MQTRLGMRYYATSFVASSVIYGLLVLLNLKSADSFSQFFFLGIILGGPSALVNAHLLRVIARKFSLTKLWQWVAVGTLVPVLSVVAVSVVPFSILLTFPVALGPCMLISFGGPVDLLLVSTGTSLALYYANKATPIKIEIS